MVGGWGYSFIVTAQPVKLPEPQAWKTRLCEINMYVLKVNKTYISRVACLDCKSLMGDHNIGIDFETLELEGTLETI